MRAPKSTKLLWLTFRLATVFGAIALSRLVMESFKDDDFSHASATFGLAMTAGSALAMLLFGSWGKPRNSTEGVPSFSWFENPFDLPRPLGAYHVGAVTLISLGLGMAVLGLAAEPRNWAWELPLSVGTGSWIGIRAVALLRGAPKRSK